MDKVRVLDRAVREIVPVTLKMLPAVVEAQLDDDRGIDAASPELLKGSSVNEGPASRMDLATKSRIALTASSLVLVWLVNCRASSATFPLFSDRSSIVSLSVFR